MTEHKIKPVGSYAEIWHGTASKSAGGLKKKDLMRHKGRIISRKKHAAGKKAIKHLRELGYIAKKGTFKLFKKSDVKKTAKKHGKRHTRKRHSRKRGGAEHNGTPSHSLMSSASKAL